MSGVIFKVIIPTQEHECAILGQSKRKSTADSQSSLLEACAIDDQVFKVKSEKKPSPKTEAVKLKAGSCEYLNKRVQIEEPIPIRKSMKQSLDDIFNEIRINNATWITTSNKNFYQITFPIESRTRCEKVLNVLKDHKIGKKLGSIVCVVPCSIYYCEDEEGEQVEEENYYHGGDPTEKTHLPHKSAWNRFVSSVRARLVVAQVAENIKTNAALTFDFACLLVIASLLCAIGLVENSSMFLLSSMLISPMMRAVMAGTFGTVIGDSKLQIMGVQNEIIGLSIATLIGFCYGAIICGATDKYGDSSWPTYEMTSRGEIRSLWVGCLVALLSGAAVALGILSDFIASLVGAAISTSLMPPAVNAGLLWSLATTYYLKGNETTRYSSLELTSFYSENKTIELATQGAVSMCLTFINIVCIYFAGILIFKIKEVAPMTSTDQAKKEFWNNDIKVARDYNKTLQNDEARNMKNQFQHGDIIPNVAADTISNSQETESLLHHHSLDLLDKVASNVNLWERQYTWSPYSYCPVAKLKRGVETLVGVSTNRKSLRFSTIKQENRRLSSLFSPSNISTGNCSTSTEDFPRRSYNLGGSAAEPNNNTASSHKMRFVVTPCALDNVNQ